MTDATAALAEFASGLCVEDVPQAVRESAKTLLLDALACALAGHRGEETTQVTGMASTLAQSGESTVVGGGGLSLAGATLLNGYLITAVTMSTGLRSRTSPPRWCLRRWRLRNATALRAANCWRRSSLDWRSRRESGLDSTMRRFASAAGTVPVSSGPSVPRPRSVGSEVSMATAWRARSGWPAASRPAPLRPGERRPSSGTSAVPRCPG